MERLLKYFPDIDAIKKDQFALLDSLYHNWNNKINVISRKDIDALYEKHVLHALAIAKIISFNNGTKILDVGSGGGFPGIPLAIMFPQCQFTLIDSIGKKVTVIEEVAKALHLKNVIPLKERAENMPPAFDFIISRAVTEFPQFYAWVKNKTLKQSANSLPNGILYLKGGDLTDELKPLSSKIKLYNISDFFTEAFFETKKIVYMPL